MKKKILLVIVLLCVGIGVLVYFSRPDSSCGSEESSNEYYKIVKPFYMKTGGKQICIEIKNISDSTIKVGIYGTNPVGEFVSQNATYIKNNDGSSSLISTARVSTLEPGKTYVIQADAGGTFSDATKFNVTIRLFD